MKTRFLTLCLLACLSWLHAQQDAQYTQYLYNTMAINPAYAGTEGLNSISALYRSQWLGMDGAPTTMTLNVQAPVSERMGLGLSIIHDEIGNGTNQDTYFDGVFSYSIPLSDYDQLAFGIKAGGHLLNIDFNKLRNYNGSSNSGTAIDRRFSPNFGLGAFYYRENTYVGLSIPNLLETEHFDRSGQASSSLSKERMNLYLMAGRVFDLNDDLKMKPAVLLKAVQGAPLQADISANFLYQERMTLGVSYRWDAAFSGLFAFQLNDEIQLGLSYDREVTALGNTAFNNGSFELFLRYNWLSEVRRFLEPRFF